MNVKLMRGWFGMLLAGMLTACSVHDIPDGITFQSSDAWAMLPVLNYSEEPLAGERAEAMMGTLLLGRGVSRLTRYPSLESSDVMPELNERRRLDQAIEWAKGKGLKYGFSGTVSEWRYKSGLDAEPAVGMTLQVIEIASGQVVWSTSAARSGWGRESLSGNAQKVMRTLVNSIHLASGN